MLMKCIINSHHSYNPSPDLTKKMKITSRARVISIVVLSFSGEELPISHSFRLPNGALCRKTWERAIEKEQIQMGLSADSLVE